MGAATPIIYTVYTLLELILTHNISYISYIYFIIFHENRLLADDSHEISFLNVSEIDDEQHLLLRCSRFSETRIAFFDLVRKSSPRIDTLNDENKFIYLLNSNGWTIKEVAKFLHSAYKACSA